MTMSMSWLALVVVIVATAAAIRWALLDYILDRVNLPPRGWPALGGVSTFPAAPRPVPAAVAEAQAPVVAPEPSPDRGRTIGSLLTGATHLPADVGLLLLGLIAIAARAVLGGTPDAARCER